MAMCPERRTAGPNVPPGTSTFSLCCAQPAPPAVCQGVHAVPGSVIVEPTPASVLPTTWMVAVPLKVADPSAAMLSEPAVTFPSTRICETLAHGPNGNPPERPAITQRNSPPDDDAVNPSCDVVPRAPSTTPPPLTLGPVAYAAD